MTSQGVLWPPHKHTHIQCTHMNVHTHSHKCIHIHVCTHTHTYTQMHAYSCMHRHSHMHTLTHTHKCMHIHVCTHIHTCTQIHTEHKSLTLRQAGCMVSTGWDIPGVRTGTCLLPQTAGALSKHSCSAQEGMCLSSELQPPLQVQRP